METSRLISPHEEAVVNMEKAGRSRSLESRLRSYSRLGTISSRLWSHARPLAWITNQIGRRRRSISPRRHALPRAIRSQCFLVRLTLKVISITVVLFLMLSIWTALFTPTYADPPQRYLDLEERVKSSAEPGRANIRNEKIFIAANIVNEDLIQGTWGENLITLVDLLGEDNVFVSIYENDSGNGTSRALRHLQQQLKCNSSIVTGQHVSLSGFPTARLPNGEQRVQRLAYLAELRNRLLRPLDPFYQDDSSTGFRKATDVDFDRILFLNDVYYLPLEATQLLFSTNADAGWAQYRAACAIDFVQLFKLYDSFVVRDTDGFRIALQFFPWFTHRGSGTSRRDVLALTDAVQVRSCWGGMAAFDASIFRPKPTPSPQSSPPNTTGLSLKFRSDGELFWEAAECCLIFADMEDQYGKPSKYDGTGVFLNPFVRTAYSTTTWRWIPFFKRVERVFQHYQSLVDLVKPPEWNPRQTHEPGEMVDELVWVEKPSHQQSSFKPNPHYPMLAAGMCPQGNFEVQHRPAKVGGFCGERRMFVMKKDIEAANRGKSGKNWENVAVPWHYELSGP